MAVKILWFIYAFFVISDLWIDYPKLLRVVVYLSAFVVSSVYLLRSSKK